MSDVDNLSSDSESEELSLLILLLRRRRRRILASSRKIWIRRWIQRRQDQGAFSNIVKELNAEDPEKFRQYHRLDRESFQDILRLVDPLISKQDTVMWTSVKPSERLAVTIRFLATGESFRSLSFQYRLGERTISGIIDDTCQALYSVLRKIFMKTPTSEQEWLEVADEFEAKWNYPCCIGSIDGKHIAIKQPDCSGSEYFNYKHFFSVLLLALVDANYKFLYISAGACGRCWCFCRLDT